MKSEKRSLYKLSVLAVAFFGLIGAGILVFGQQPEAEKTGVPDDWSHHHLIFTNPGTATQAIANGRFTEWYKTIADPRFKLQQLKRGAAATPAQGTTDATGADEAARSAESYLQSSSKKKNTLKRDWSQLLGPSASSSIYVAPGMSGGFWNVNPKTDVPGCGDYVVFGVDATPGTGQPNLVGLTNLYNSTCTGTVPTVMFAYYEASAGPVVTSPALGLASGEVLYVENSTLPGARLHVLTGAGSGSTKGAVNAPVLAGSSGTGSTDTAILLNGSPTVTYSSVFYDYGDDIAFVGDDSGHLHKFNPVFRGTGPAEVVSTGSTAWPAAVSSTALTSPVLDTTSGKVWVSDGSKLYAVSPNYGSGTGGTIVASVSLGSNVVDSPIVDSTDGFVYLFVGDGTTNAEVAQFQISGFTTTPVSATHVATVGTSNTSIHMYDGDFDNNFYTNGTGNLYVCGNPGGNPTLYSVAVASGAISTTSGTAGPVLASSNVACSPLVEFDNTTDWLFGGVAGSSCGATGATTAGGCVMSFNIASAPTIGPWMPSYAFPASAEIVDTNGNLQKCTSGCGDTGGNSGTTAPATWGSTANATTNDNVTNATALGTVSTVPTSGTPTVTVGSLTLQATAPVAEVATITVNTNNYCIPPGAGVSVGTTPTSVTTNGTVPTGGSISIISGSGSVGMSITIGGVTYVWESSLATSGCGTTLNCLLGGLTGTGGHAADAEALFRAVNNSGQCVDNGTTTCYVLATGQGANAAAVASHTAGATSTSISTWKCAGTTAAQWVVNSCGTGETCTNPTGGTAGTSGIIMPSPISAGNLASAINTALASTAGFTHGVAGSVVTLTASALGSTGITDSLVGSPAGITVGVTTAGSNGSNTAPDFEYWSGNAAVSTNTLASNIAAAAAGNSDNVTVTYNSGTNTFTASGTGTNAAAAGNSVSVGGTLTGLAWTNGGTSTTTLKGGTGIVWTYQSASTGQTTAAAPTGSSGLIVDNNGTATGEANVYFGTLSGTGAPSSAVKMSQNGLK